MATTSTGSLQAFNFAQTFFIDPGTVKNAPEVSITSVGIYFYKKPTATKNKSGITNPGVTLYLSETKSNGADEIPDVNSLIYGAVSRKEYSSVAVSNTAETQTLFSFPYPVNLNTGRTYAILVKYDGDEEFDVWKSVEGDKLVGTNNKTAGPTGKYIGKYFEYSQMGSGGNTSLNTTSSGGVSGTWKPLSTTDLKFVVNCAKFTPDSYANTVTSDPATGKSTINVIGKRSYILEKEPYEFFVYDRLNSTNVDQIVGGEIAWQNNFTYAETVSVKSGNSIVTTSKANFSTVFGNSTNDKYIVVESGDNRNIRKVSSITSNTVIVVDRPFSFTAPAASFSKVAAGKIDIVSKTLAFGKSESAIVLTDSSANSTLRFTNNVVEDLTIVAGGSGYANSNYILVSGGGANGGAAEVNATANLTTNSTGGIVSLRINNKGVGFLTTPTLSIKAANGASSNGTGANVTFTIGSTLLTETSNAVLSDAHLVNVPVNTVFVGAVDVENPYGTSYYFKQHYVYYGTSDAIVDVAIADGGTGYANGDVVTFSGGDDAEGKVLTDSSGTIVDVIMVSGGSGYASGSTVSVTTSAGSGAALSAVIGVFRNSSQTSLQSNLVDLFKAHKLASSNTPMVLSRSYEVTQPNVSITTVTGKTVNTNSSSVLEMVTTSNNEFVVADILSGELDVFYQKFSINDDATDEEFGDGKALSKTLTPALSFANNRTAEDIRVYVDAYRPANTDIKVYARVHNSKDPEAFVDKDWTLLEIKSNNGGTYSNPTFEADIIEFEYGFPSYPPIDSTLTGTVSTTLSSSNVTGSNTTFSTDLDEGDAVRIYSELFPENYMVSTVASVTNNTLMTLSNPVSNSDVVGSGFKVDKVDKPHQVFNDGLSQNVASYFDTTGAIYRGYNTYAVKIVFLSPNETIVPKVDSVRITGVTA